VPGRQILHRLPSGAEVSREWQNSRVLKVLALAVTALAAVIFGRWLPRGPITAFDGITMMIASLGVGVLSGVAFRSKWAVLAAPLVFSVVYELARIGTDGPTVDGIHLSTYGVMAFVVGRGVIALLALAPMVFGAAIGTGIVHRRVAILGGLALILLAVAVIRPAGTDQITGPDGKPLPGSIAELTRTTIGDKDLALMLRGRNKQNPVLLYLAGGPGGSELGAMRRHLEELEQDFVVATWDQRGTGKSYGQLDPRDTLTLEGQISDTIEVTNYLRKRFGQERIYLLGQSWGTTLGVLAAKRAPELYRAYIGTGQMVSQRETDRIFYSDTLEWARANDEDKIVSKLTDIGPPPYTDILNYEPALTHEHEVYPYDHSGNSEGAGGFSENIFVKEYTLLEQLHTLGAFLDTFSVLYPQLQKIDFREQVSSLDVPVYLIQGRHEARGRSELARAWFADLKAPMKKLIVIDGAGHRPLFERPAEFHDAMVTRVLGETARR
jgi:pimeloyl-ACP methyl ester carboxylesterase